jgi:hypothetical protein
MDQASILWTCFIGGALLFLVTEITVRFLIPKSKNKE